MYTHVCLESNRGTDSKHSGRISMISQCCKNCSRTLERRTKDRNICVYSEYVPDRNSPRRIKREWREILARSCLEMLHSRERVEEIINKRTVVQSRQGRVEADKYARSMGFKKISRGIRGVYGIVRVQVHGTFGIFGVAIEFHEGMGLKISK